MFGNLGKITNLFWVQLANRQPFDIRSSVGPLEKSFCQVKMALDTQLDDGVHPYVFFNEWIPKNGGSVQVTPASNMAILKLS